MARRLIKKYDQYELQGKEMAASLEQYIFGRPMPQAVELEQAVLGAIMLDSAAYAKVNFLKPEHFYLEVHQVIFKAMLRLVEKGAPVDLLTVTQSLSGIKKYLPDGSFNHDDAGQLQDNADALSRIGGPAFIVELTDRVASAANIEYHGRIILQKYLSREAIQSCCVSIERLYAESEDVFEIRNKLSQKMLVMPFTSYFEIRTASEVMEEAKNEPDLVCVAGEVLKQGEISILFAEPGAGKSIFGVQIADAVSKGEGLFDGLLRNEIGAAKVLYIDQELTKPQFRDRYSDRASGKEYPFNANFIRAAINNDFIDFPDTEVDRYIMQQIENAIIMYEPSVIILDNITALSSESNADDNVAKRIMQNLRRILLKYKLSILVLAHTNKRYNKMQMLDMENMRGSFLISAFASTIFGIGIDANDDNLLYIKQLKGRSGKVYNSENVIKCHRIKKDSTFLCLEYLGLSNEKDHLQQLTSEQTVTDQLIEDAVKLRAKDNNFSWRVIVKQIGYPYSYETLRKKCMRFCENSLDYEYNETTGQISVLKWDDKMKTKGTTDSDNEIDSESPPSIPF
jgi:replicative DNA helicase